MKKVIDFLKKYWLLISLAFVVTVFSIFWLNQRAKITLLKPSASPSAGILPQPQSKFSQLLGENLYYNLLFTRGDFEKMPQTLTVYQTKKFNSKEITSRFSELIKEVVSSENSEEQQRPDGKYLVWQEKNNYLSINISSGQFLFVGQLPLTSNEKENLNPVQIQNLVKEKLVSWNLILTETKTEKIEGFGQSGLELIPVASLGQAVVFQITYNPSFDGFPLIGLGPAKNPIEVKIDKQGILLSLSFNLHEVDKTTTDNYPLKSYEETVKEIKEGQAQIIQVLTPDQEERSFPSLEEISEIEIRTISAAYYETLEAQEFYQPVFLLKGSLTLKNKEVYQASFILSAIASEWLKPIQEHFTP